MIPKRIYAIEKAISEAAGVSITDMRGKLRNSEYAQARMAVWYIAFDHLNYSYKAIARFYNRDHTTIMHGVAKIRKCEYSSRKILEGIKKVCPDVLDKPMDGEARGLEHWDF